LDVQTDIETGFIRWTQRSRPNKNAVELVHQKKTILLQNALNACERHFQTINSKWSRKQTPF